MVCVTQAVDDLYTIYAVQYLCRGKVELQIFTILLRMHRFRMTIDALKVWSGSFAMLDAAWWMGMYITTGLF